MKKEYLHNAAGTNAGKALCRAGCLALVLLVVAACSSAPTCDELAFYETAVGGKRIEAPDDLNQLDQLKEFAIPDASPRPPRDLSAGCLDLPPTLKLE